MKQIAVLALVVVKGILLATLIVLLGYALARGHFPIHWGALLVFVITCIATHAFLFSHRGNLTKGFIKSIDYAAILLAAVGLFGAADLHVRLAQSVAPVVTTEMKGAMTDVIREYRAIKARCNEPEHIDVPSDEQNQAIVDEVMRTQRSSRAKLCAFVRENENPELLLAQNPFAFLNAVLDHSEAVEGPLRLQTFNNAVERYLRASIRFEWTMPYINSQENFPIKTLGWMLLALGLGLRFSRTTAEIFEWHIT